jgi:benzoylformate decarboxylase
VLVLGAPVFLYYPYFPGPTVEEGTRVLQVTEDPEEATRAAAGDSVVGDVGAAIRALTELLPETDRPAPPAPQKPPVPEAATPIPVEYVMHTISEVLPEGTAIFDESISSKAKLHTYIRPNRPGGYHTSAAGGLGFAMPASVGFKLAAPERPVACIIGDGSSLYSIQALWSAARYDADVAFIVVNNSGYSILKGFRDALGVGEKVPGLDVPDVDVVQLARSFGVEGETVEKAGALGPAVERAFDAGRPYLVDVVVDPEVPKLLG